MTSPLDEPIEAQRRLNYLRYCIGRGKLKYFFVDEIPVRNPHQELTLESFVNREDAEIFSFIEQSDEEFTIKVDPFRSVAKITNWKYRDPVYRSRKDIEDQQV